MLRKHEKKDKQEKYYVENWTPVLIKKDVKCISNFKPFHNNLYNFTKYLIIPDSSCF